jgi:mono/diheme cytochrome c family protein
MKKYFGSSGKSVQSDSHFRSDCHFAVQILCMGQYFLPMLVLVMVLTLAACGGGGPQEHDTVIPKVPADFAGKTMPASADAVKGAEVFNINCASCHGATGEGDGPAGAALDPRPENLVVFAPQVGDDYLFWRISTGKEGTNMVAWAGVLTEAQIWDVVSFIRTLK